MKTDFLDRAGPVLIAFVFAEVLLPTGLLWLSDRFLFDIPDYALWLAFGTPMVTIAVTPLAWLVLPRLLPHWPAGQAALSGRDA